MSTSTQWQLAREAAERYEHILVPAILGPAAQTLVDWSSIRAGQAVLDVGCGTGAATRYAADRAGSSGRVVGLDVNAGMIEVAKASSTTTDIAIEWFENSAYELPFADREFDVALCAQTLQFLDNKPRALSEIHRVLKSDGRICVSAWCECALNPYFAALVDAISRHIGPQVAAGLNAAFGLADANAVRALLIDAEFKSVTTAVQQLDLDLPPVREFIPQHVSATPMAAGFQAATEQARESVIREVAGRMAAYETDKGIRVPFRTHLAMGVA
jgi:ubiquinone/menaquinone biosynthesis C-methylase UbiE